MIVASDNEPDFWKSIRNASLFFIVQMSGNDDEIRVASNLRKDLLDRFHNVESRDAFEIARMSGRCQFSCRRANDPKTKALHRRQRVLLDLGNWALQIGG